MDKQVIAIKKIKSDGVKELDFSATDVLSKEVDQKKRLIELRKATLANRTKPRMVRIIFRSSDGFKMVETSELTLNNSYVSLKKGCFLPLRSIYSTKSLI